MAAQRVVFEDEGLFGLIMEQLDLPDLAATARTCSAFATAVATLLRPLLKPNGDAFDIFEHGVPRSLCMLPGHNLVIGDTYNHRIYIANPARRSGSPSAAPRNWKQFYYPQGLVTDGESIWVSTACFHFEGAGNVHRVIKFRASDGMELASSNPGDIEFPGALALGKNHLYEIDAEECIHVLDKDKLEIIGHYMIPDIKAVLEVRDELIITQSSNHHVLFLSPLPNTTFDHDPNEVVHFRLIGGPGCAPGQFQSPSGLAVADGHLIVGDKSRIQVLTMDGDPRQVIHVADANDLCAMCVSDGFLYVADALGRRLHRYQLMRAQDELSAKPCHAVWGSKKIVGQSRWERQQETRAAVERGEACSIQ